MNFTYNKNRDRSALTLIELLVSTAILSMMVLLFSLVLNATQKVTSAAHATMRGNAAAAAIADAIRKDFARITRNGFLCITQTAASSSPVLMFTTSGTTSSVLSDNVATEAVVMLGLCPNTATANGNVLWAKRMLLDTSATALTDDDIWTSYNFFDIQAETNRAGVNTRITNAPGTGLDQEIPLGIEVSSELDAAAGLWQVLAVDCEGLSIMWTDGSDGNGDGHMDWYGIVSQYNSAAMPPAYEYVIETPRAWATRNATSGSPEFDGAPTSPAFYRALWSRDRAIWPSAVKISFVITDPDMPEQVRDQRYEVICPIN